MHYPEIPVLHANFELTGMSYLIPDVTYAEPNGEPLKMQIFIPWQKSKESNPKKYPLIIFIQGSAWQNPDVYFELPQLSQYARSGYVVATITHRNCLDDHPFPAFLQDVKTAIRFLRNAHEKYHIDSNRVAVFGTSSGGNAALLTGLTGDSTTYKTDVFPDISDSVKVVIDCFGPTDIPEIVRDIGVQDPRIFESRDDNFFYAICGGPVKENAPLLHALSPYHIVENGKDYPAFFLLHGDADHMVPYQQSKKMFHRLYDAGADVRMLRIEGGTHEGSFWSQAVHDQILSFLQETL